MDDFGTTAFRDILSRYTDPVPIGRGGQKYVYRITHERFGQIVLKVGRFDSFFAMERIKREIRTLESIDSIYFPRIYEFTIQDDNKFIILEQYIPSIPLSDCLNNFTERNSILNLIGSIISGLNILWQRNIVHRDIKPQNILIKDDAKPVIIDLGIARLLDEDSLTQSFLPSGPCTYAYAAPEQLLNHKDDIDYRTDQFALGILMLLLINNGRHPFDLTGGNLVSEIAYNIVNGNIIPITPTTLMSDSFYKIAFKMLGHEPYQRFRRVDTLLSAIETAIGE
jgi:eukaryotic-like serine/threonine-protein kinase